MAGELRGSMAELTGRSWGSGRVWSGGSTVGRDSPELEEGGGVGGVGVFFFVGSRGVSQQR